MTGDNTVTLTRSSALKVVMVTTEVSGLENYEVKFDI